MYLFVEMNNKHPYKTSYMLLIIDTTKFNEKHCTIAPHPPTYTETPVRN